jgi:hypothetical protein
MREELLKKEMEELHNYVRSHFQLLIAWFTFFCTVVVGAAAWGVGASLDDKHRLVTSLPIFVVASFYTVQTALGGIACWLVNRDMRRIQARIRDIQRDLTGQRSGEPLQPHSPMPPSLNQCVLLIIVTLASILPFLWWTYHLVTVLPKATQCPGAGD